MKRTNYLQAFILFSLLPAICSAQGIITTVAGGNNGNGDTALAYSANAVQVCYNSGYVYYVDNINQAIMKDDIATGILTRVAGGGPYLNDGGPATASSLGSAVGMAFDKAGNLYFADGGDQRVRIINTSGIVNAYAGCGIAGYSGDGGPATAAEINSPKGVAVDASGNIFISDDQNNCVREVNALSGIISTVAGNHAYGAGFSGDGGPATAAEINSPQGIFVDSIGEVFFSDFNNKRIRKVNSSGIIGTVAGNGIFGSSGDGGPATAAEIIPPEGLTFNSKGEFFITSQSTVRMVNTSGVITTVAGTVIGYGGDGGPATAAKLANPQNASFDPAGNMYISDWNNSRVREVTYSTQIISTLVGNGTLGYYADNMPATRAELQTPYNVAFDSAGNFYIVDGLNYVIRKVDITTGFISTVAGNLHFGFSGDGGPATAAELLPYWVAFDKHGNMDISDNDRIRQINSSGVINTIAGNGTLGYSGDGGPASAAEFYIPQGFIYDDSDNIYMADANNQRIRKINHATGIVTSIAGNGVIGYSGDGGPATAAEFKYPSDLAFDKAGNIYVVDEENNRVRKIDKSSGIITTVVGNGIRAFSGDGGPATAAELNLPAALFVDGYGDIYVSEFEDGRVRLVNATSGNISTVAGGGGSWIGDGGLATDAAIESPSGIALDNNGNLYISDKNMNRVRMVTGPLSINELTNKTGISVYPNPSNGKFNVAIMNYHAGMANIEVFNMMGQIIYSQVSVLNTQLSIDLTTQPNGIYLIAISNKDGVLVGKQKVIKINN